jgi:hypothetical protein
MAKPRIKNLTKSQKAILRSCIVREAARLGYGKKYTEWNRPDWPPRLRELSVMSDKLRAKGLFNHNGR